VASTVGVRIIANVTSEAGPEPCIKEDVKEANIKYSSINQRAIVHSSLMTAKGDYTEQLVDDRLETPGDTGQVASLSPNPDLFEQTLSVAKSPQCLLVVFQESVS